MSFTISRSWKYCVPRSWDVSVSYHCFCGILVNGPTRVLMKLGVMGCNLECHVSTKSPTASVFRFLLPTVHPAQIFSLKKITILNVVFFRSGLLKEEAGIGICMIWNQENSWLSKLFQQGGYTIYLWCTTLTLASDSRDWGLMLGNQAPPFHRGIMCWDKRFFLPSPTYSSFDPKLAYAAWIWR